MCSSFLRWNQFKFWPLSSYIFQRGKQPSCQVAPEIPVIPTVGVWKVEGLDTPLTIYIPGSFTLKPAQENRERLLPNSIFINCWKWKTCLSTGLVDKIAPSNLPIIFRLLKIIWKISPRAGSDLVSLSAQHRFSIPMLGCLHVYACPAPSYSLPLWSSSCWLFSCSSWSSSMASLLRWLPCFLYLALTARSSLFPQSFVYINTPS